MYKTLIDFNSLLNQLDNNNLVIFDVRYDLMNKSAGREAYSLSHIPGAIYVDLGLDLSRKPSTNRSRHPLPQTETMNKLFSELGINSNKQVIIYDNVFGAFAARLWWMLNHMQHKRVAVLDGGWQQWINLQGPTCSKIEKPKESKFNNAAMNDSVVCIERVRNFDLIIDSREPSRYRGDSEPIDKKAGHIPNAINRFWKNNLNNSGLFKEQNILVEEFEELFGETSSENAVFYCGSGVTACHNLLAAVHAGFDLPRLYAGSWSEWCATSGKEIAVSN